MRKKACDVLFFLYRSVNPGHTRYHFDNLVTEDSAKELREQLIETIRDEFDRMDGKPTKKEIEVIVMIYEILSAYFNKLYFTTSFIFILTFLSENSDTGTKFI